MTDYTCDPADLAKKAADPNKMGGHGQPTGRPMEGPQERDINHPQGTNERAKLPGGSSEK